MKTPDSLKNPFSETFSKAINFLPFVKQSETIQTINLRSENEHFFASGISDEKPIEREDHLLAVANSVQDAIVSADNEGRIIFWNEGARKSFGYSEEEAIGKSLVTIMPQRYREAHVAGMRRFMQTNEKRVIGQTVELHGLRKDGSEFPIELSLGIWETPAGKYFTGVMRDITERKKSEKALRKSETKLRTLLDNMSEGLLQINFEQKIEFVNDRFCELVEYERDEILGCHITKFLYDESDNKCVREAHGQLDIKTTKHFELKLRKKSGGIIYALVGCAPLTDGDGNIIGAMGVFTDNSERKRAEDQLIYDAFHDTLTGLANRALFMDHLRLTIERSRSRHSNQYAVLFLDFDRFKVINDSLGHTEGDELLRQIAGRLIDLTRTGDLIARIGGDEFVILVNELAEAEESLIIAERILHELKIPFELAGKEIYMTASIGIALSTSGHKRAEDMLRDADIAMYYAKSKGKAQYQIFDRSMHEKAAKQLSLETEMRRALDNNEFELHYQPIINLENGMLKGFESLVRWRHPKHGIISPLEFIPLAEENGLIFPLSDWILNESCRQMNYWHNLNPAFAHLTLSVNLSTKQFSQPNLVSQMTNILEKTRLNPNYLRLEITESELIENSESAVKTMNALQSLGIRWSLDDFGTGYSSLGYLHNLPFHLLKIDCTFIDQMLDSTEKYEIVNTIIKLGKSLKLAVVAEGIEDKDQLLNLKKMGCQFGQGFLFAKALMPADAEIFIKDFYDIPDREDDYEALRLQPLV